MSFLHGIEVIELTSGSRPISTVRASVIGLIGTAPSADADAFPLNTPVLIAGRRTEAAALGSEGTLPGAIDGIFDQTGAMVVVVRVAEGADDAETLSNLIGGIDPDSGQYEGVQAFLSAESELGVTPRLLIAPGFSQEQALATELISIAGRLRAIALADGPNTNDADAITYIGNFGSDRLYVVDPWVKVWDTQTSSEIMQPASARVAGMIALSDSERGFWWSPSNREMLGITGTARAVDFALGDANARANYLNENKVATIIRKDGYRLWGNRTTASDAKWAFINVRRTADMINESILQAHLWAVDRNINRTYVENVVEGVNNYMRALKARGAIINGEAWADPELNPPSQITQGKVTIDFKFSANYPAEHLTFRSQLTNEFLTEIFGG